VERRLNCRIYTPSRIPKGTDLITDLHRFGYAARIGTVFDVGANVGEFSAGMLHGFPAARVWAFEPVRETFAALEENLSRSSAFQAFNCAFGDQPGVAKMRVQGGSHLASIIDPSRPGAGDSEVLQNVPVDTIDTFCRAREVSKIDLLKIDTEGYEMQVLAGAEAMLSKGAAGMVLAEVSFHGDDSRHTPFSSVWAFLSSRGFDLFGFYQQSWYRDRHAMDYCDALFLNRAWADSRLPWAGGSRG